MFDGNFRVCFADTPFGVALHQRIRYQVFCLDKGFENPEAFSTAHETDVWDDHSAHFIVQDLTARHWVAATRLVLPHPEMALPVEKALVLSGAAREGITGDVAEISRFCVINARSAALIPRVSQGHAESHSLSNSLEDWGIGPVRQGQQFEVTLGMIRAVVIYALKRGIEHCYVLITDAFARVLRRIGVRLIQVGPAVDYRGMRTPYIIELRESVLSMTKRSSAVQALFRRSRQAYTRISAIVPQDGIDSDSEFAPDHALFHETLFRETVLLPAEADPGLGPAV